jgi:hypothetical protein
VLGNLRNAIQYAVGFPLLAIQMIAHVPESRCTPCRLMVYQSDQVRTFCRLGSPFFSACTISGPEIIRIALSGTEGEGDPVDQKEYLCH